MDLANLIFRLFRPRQSAEFDCAVERLRQGQNPETPLNRVNVVSALRAIAEREPRTRDELTELEAESFLLGERIRKSTVCDDLPHLVWHFLSDADIRFKDERYRQSQLRLLEECIAAWEDAGV